MIPQTPFKMASNQNIPTNTTINQPSYSVGTYSVPTFTSINPDEKHQNYQPNYYTGYTTLKRQTNLVATPSLNETIKINQIPKMKLNQQERTYINIVSGKQTQRENEPSDINKSKSANIVGEAQRSFFKNNNYLAQGQSFKDRGLEAAKSNQIIKNNELCNGKMGWICCGITGLILAAVVVLFAFGIFTVANLHPNKNSGNQAVTGPVGSSTETPVSNPQNTIIPTTRPSPTPKAPIRVSSTFPGSSSITAAPTAPTTAPTFPGSETASAPTFPGATSPTAAPAAPTTAPSGPGFSSIRAVA